ncbi:oligosaccharide flippase family protein [Acinetobacter radioresistens]|uniref:oligosaccharide flippase family protein n=1 Tax=Acinetobacter radioresistens TaxID=40216 RepID=UPI002002B302|nr:oligosaccharide flippase family protein [Acinetobacter radioresistens]
MYNMTVFLKIQNLFKSKDLRQLAENFFSLSILKVVNLILPLITLPYLIKVLGFHYYGAIILALSLIAYFQALTDYGFNLSATRDVARHRHSQKQLSLIYSKTIWSKIVLLSGSLIFLLLLIYFVPQFKEDRIIFLLMCLMLIGNAMFPEWFFRGVEKMRYITILDLFVKLLFTIGVFVFIHQPKDYWLYPFLFSCGYIISAIISYFIIYKSFSIKLRIVKISQVKSTLRKGFPLFINQFIPTLFNSTTNFMVGIFLGKSAAGLFGVLRQLIQILTVLNGVVTSIFYPYLIRNKAKFKIYSIIYLIIFTIIVFIYGLSHMWLFNWVGIKGDNANEVFISLLLGALSISFYSVFATNYLIVRGYDNFVMRYTVGISLMGFLTCYPLLKNFGLVGGALNILLCQFLLGIIAVIGYVKFSKEISNA